MRSALYYPHTSITNVELTKTALLLWDQLEYIVPWKHFDSRFANPGIARAMELIGAAHYPSDGEKLKAHQQIEDLVSSGLPPEFYWQRSERISHDADYQMYPQKLLPDTWRLLRQAGISGNLLFNSDYPLREVGGLAVMSILADCCAGTTRSRITDRGDAYATVANLLGRTSSTSRIQRVNLQSHLVPISLRVIDTSHLDLAALIHLREQEQRETGNTLRDLRHRYIDGLKNYVTQLTSEKTTEADAVEVQRQFADDMRRDLQDLKAELGFARREAILSKELLTVALTTAGTAAAWLFGAPLNLEGVVTTAGVPMAIGGVLGARNKYLKERSNILKKHPMAYLYETRNKTSNRKAFGQR